jgi:Tol biopolymer transport system component
MSFARDGTRIAFSRRSGEPDDWLLKIANSDGSGVRPVIRADDDSSHGTGVLPLWSPTGGHLAYLVPAPDDTGNVHLKIVDIATGTARTLVAGFSYAFWPPHSWSRDGDRILFSKEGVPATQLGPTGSLWSVDAEGGDATLLVEGATSGEWQPASPGQ